MVEGEYSEESEEEDQTVQIQSVIKKIENLLATQRKKNGKRREKSFYTPGASPGEYTLPRHFRPEDSPILPTPGPRATSTPKTEKRSQSVPNKVYSSTPNHPSPLQQEIPEITSPIVKIRAKDYNHVFDGNEVENLSRVKEAAIIERASREDIGRIFLC
ncbi:hypothetical protein O181_016103 [Austropuccinia psidii MF-1]|uniref:Uncharacterized protein n=1 Tax=Austropuccinia psidii MF-1 TaxID=1389203 RepID=A0A9Q3C3Q0_9BASI|nr:hypothetical protein [Austropuccinia psidii MF-1]